MTKVKKIILKMNINEFDALMDLMDSASSVFEENEVENKNIKSIDFMLKENGYKRNYNEKPNPTGEKK
jgi:hypothetical protein